MVDWDRNEEVFLHDREGRQCHFTKRFTYQDYDVQLRLDWDDIATCEPKLYVDITDIDPGKLLKEDR